MPPSGPIKRRDLIDGLGRLGFSGPYSGGKHEYMERPGRRIPVPNRHECDVSRGRLARILREAAVSPDEWEAL